MFGPGGISIWQLLIILVIVALIFGTKRLRNIGGDLGGAVKGFKKAITEDEKEAEETVQAAASEAEEAAQAESTDTKNS